jgi:site-specific DNA-methyltransferase (adenine-specific)
MSERDHCGGGAVKVNFEFTTGGAAATDANVGDSLGCNFSAHDAPGSCVLSKSSENEASANRLYFGDNLNVLRNKVPDNSVDLIYLDPPFNSKASYNLLYKTPVGAQEDAQIKAFKDTWNWEEDGASLAMEDIRKQDLETFKMLQAMQMFLGESDIMAYLAMMTVRLQILHKKLKDTGSIYLHCDPTASHYLKIMMDAIFGATNYR